MAMHNKSRIRRLAWAVSMMLLAAAIGGCATSKVTENWHDPSYSGSQILDNVLIIGISKNETMRRLYEDSFVEKVVEAGNDAHPSYTLSNPAIDPNKKAVEAAVREAGAGSVLITRHISTDSKEYYRPSTRSSFYADRGYMSMSSYYPMAYQEMGYTTTVDTVVVEAVLYDVKTEKLVWSARSKSVNPPDSKKYVDELVNIFTTDLKKNGLL